MRTIARWGLVAGALAVVIFVFVQKHVLARAVDERGEDRKAVNGVLKAQQSAWNRGDVDAFLPDAALVLGRWQLKRDKDDIGGVFTLVWQRFPDGWKIIHDHTSAVAPPKPNP